MGSTDWIEEGNITLSIDSNIKHSGNSSFKVNQSTGGNAGITRGNSQQAKVILWVYKDEQPLIVGHLSYGNHILSEALATTWEKWRITFWYDASNNTKFSRRERWESEAWVQKGADSNHGNGSPSANPIRLGGQYSGDRHFDDIECYSESL